MLVKIPGFAIGSILAHYNFHLKNSFKVFIVIFCGKIFQECQKGQKTVKNCEITKVWKIKPQSAGIEPIPALSSEYMIKYNTLFRIGA